MAKTIGIIVAAALLCVGAANAQRSLSDNQSRQVAEAIRNDDENTLLRLLPNKEDLDARLSTGDTSLFVAASLGRKAMVERLLERGADLNATSGRGWTPLMVAIFYGHQDIAALMLDRKAMTAIRGRDGTTPRSLAEWRGDADLVALMPAETPRQPVADDLITAVSAGDNTLLDKLLALGVAPTASDEQGNPAIVVAAVLGDLKAVKSLLKAGAPADFAGPNGVTSLMVAVQQENAEIIGRLLEEGANPAVHGADGVSAVTIAEAMGKPELAWTLRTKSHGLDDDGSLQLLAITAAENEMEKVKTLTASGVNPNGGRVDGKQIVPLSIAAFRGSSETVKYLIKAGALIDAPDSDGITSLMAAIAGNHPAIASILTENGADTQIKSNAGLSPTNMARAMGWIAIGDGQKSRALFTVEEFLDAVKHGDVPTIKTFLGTNMSKTLLAGLDERGWNALMYAAFSGDIVVVRLLLDNGATEPPGKGERGMSPLMLAASKDKLDVVDLLLNYGANPLSQNKIGDTAEKMASAHGNLKVAARLKVGTTEYIRRINAGLVALGVLDKGGDTWGTRNREAIESLFLLYGAAMRFINENVDSDTVAIAKVLTRVQRACNATPTEILMALVFADITNNKEQNVIGWTPIPPGQCQWVRRKASAGFPLRPMWIYAYAGKTEWTGNHQLCVTSSHMSVDYRSRMDVACEKTARPAKFFELSINPDPFIFRLSNSGIQR